MEEQRATKRDVSCQSIGREKEEKRREDSHPRYLERSAESLRPVPISLARL